MELYAANDSLFVQVETQRVGQGVVFPFDRKRRGGLGARWRGGGGGRCARVVRAVASCRAAALWLGLGRHTMGLLLLLLLLLRENEKKSCESWLGASE